MQFAFDIHHLNKQGISGQNGPSILTTNTKIDPPFIYANGCSELWTESKVTGIQMDILALVESSIMHGAEIWHRQAGSGSSELIEPAIVELHVAY